MTSLEIYGANWCTDTKRTVKYCEDNKIPFIFKNIEESKENMEFVEKINNGLRIIPTVVLPNNDILTEPSNAELERSLFKLNQK